MYCEEPILNVWYLESRQTDDYNWDFTDYHFDVAYYAAGETRLVFQTENHYITIGADGVRTWNDKEEFVTPGLGLYNYDDWYDDDEDSDDDDDTKEEYKDLKILSEEVLYFQGERIINVTNKEDGWLIEFDHFSMMLYPRTEKEQPWSSYYNFLPYKKLDHKLKRCQCGGEARLMVDQVDDYYICCASCFRSTYADYRLAVVVERWNNGDCPVEEDHTPFECFFRRKDKTIKDIFIPRNARYLNPDHISCDEPILQFDDTAFELTSLFIPGDRSIFNIVYQLSNFNPEIWPNRIELNEGEDGFRFVSLGKEKRNEVLTLTTGKRNIVITALPNILDISLQPREGEDRT